MEGGHDDDPAPPPPDFTDTLLDPSPWRTTTPTTKASPRRPSRTRGATASAPTQTPPLLAVARPAPDSFESPLPRRRAKRQRPNLVARERTVAPVVRPGVSALAWVLGGALLCGGGGGGAMGAQQAATVAAFVNPGVGGTGGSCSARKAGVRVGGGAGRPHTQV